MYVAVSCPKFHHNNILYNKKVGVIFLPQMSVQSVDDFLFGSQCVVWYNDVPSDPLPSLSEWHGPQCHWTLQGFHLEGFAAYLSVTEFGDGWSGLWLFLDQVLGKGYQMAMSQSQTTAHQVSGKKTSDSNPTSSPLQYLTEDLSM